MAENRVFFRCRCEGETAGHWEVWAKEEVARNRHQYQSTQGLQEIQVRKYSSRHLLWITFAPYLWLMDSEPDPGPDPASFVSDLQDKP